MTSQPHLFLDFDGVLHPNLPQPGQHMTKLPLLAAALQGTAVQIVISSSWRFHHDLDALCASFPDELRQRVVGITGEPHVGRHARWHEITHYVRTHRLRNWRSLDDSRFDFPNPCEELIWCEGSRGLEQPQVASLIRWLAAEHAKPS
jgi:hypothetical protein